MVDWIDAHGLLVLFMYFVYSNLAGALPSPEEVKSAKPDVNQFSLLVYSTGKKFIDLTAANAARVFPQLRVMSNGEKKNGG